MTGKLEIAGRAIGKEHRPLVIAEIGINHGGSLSIAKTIVDSAKRAGAEVIKHQTHIIDDEMSSHAKTVIPGNTDVSIYDVIKKNSLSPDKERELKHYVEANGLIYISTPFSRAAADFLEELDVPAYKVGSGECNNYPLIEHIANFGKPMIVSTGMNSIESIEITANILRDRKVPFALLHCTNIYPTPHHLVRLGAMQQMQEAFPDAAIGLSDHTVDNYACLAAVALGANILERHYTDTKERKGPDIVCSMDETELKDLIFGANVIHQALGGSKGLISEEKVTADFAFASVVSIKDISMGERFSKDNIWVKRPGSGELNASQFQDILGKPSTRDISKNEQLLKSDIG